MSIIRMKYLLILTCLFIPFGGIANNSDTTKMPYLKLVNCKFKNTIRYLIEDKNIQEDDVLLINIIEKNGELYVDLGISGKNRFYLKPSSLSCRGRQFIGFSIIFDHDCFVFGAQTGFFSTTKDSVQIPRYFNWLLSIDSMEIDDFYQYDTIPDSDGNLVVIPIIVTVRGYYYRYVKKHFIEISGLEWYDKIDIQN